MKNLILILSTLTALGCTTAPKPEIKVFCECSRESKTKPMPLINVLTAEQLLRQWECEFEALKEPGQ